MWYTTSAATKHAARIAWRLESGSGGAAHEYGSGVGRQKARIVVGKMTADPTARKASPPRRRSAKDAAFQAVEAMKNVSRWGVCVPRTRHHKRSQQAGARRRPWAFGRARVAARQGPSTSACHASNQNDSRVHSVGGARMAAGM